MASVYSESRALRWMSRTLKTGAFATEVMRVINKTSLIRAARWVVDVANFRARRRRAVPELRPANAQEQGMVESLRQNGYAMIPADFELDLRRQIRDETFDLKQKYEEMKRRQPERYKDIWNYVSDAGFSQEKPDPSNVFVRYALSRPILNVIAGYLGETPWLRYIILTESVHQGGPIKYSQKWHYDFDDVRMAKLFIYLSDVKSSEDGPFRLVSPGESRRVRNSFVKKHLDDEQLFAYVDPGKVTDMIAPALTSFIGDPGSMYHCGSRVAPGHSRLLYTALYTAYPSVYPNGKELFSVTPETPVYLRHVLTPMTALQKD